MALGDLPGRPTFGTRELRRRWRADLAAAGLRLGPGPAFSLSRTFDHARVEVTLVNAEGPRFRLYARHAGLPRELVLRADQPVKLLARPFLPPDVPTHDAVFDGQVRLEGDAGWILAAFNRKTRELSLACLDAGLSIEGGVLSGELLCVRPAVLVAWVGRAGDLVQRLAMAREEVPQRLLRIVERHPLLPARTEALKLLGALNTADGRLWTVLRRVLQGPEEVQALARPLAARWLAAEPMRARELPERELLQQISGANQAVKLAIITHLGERGSAASLPTLRRVAGAFLERSAVRNAARSALESLLARTHERVGGLSVVEDTGAALSLVDEDL